MYVETDCSWLDERTDLNNVVGTIDDKSTALFMHDRTCCHGMTRLNSDVTTTMNLVVVSNRFCCTRTNPVDSPSCNNILNRDWTILLICQSCSIMSTGLLSRQLCDSLWYFKHVCASKDCAHPGRTHIRLNVANNWLMKTISRLSTPYWNEARRARSKRVKNRAPIAETLT